MATAAANDARIVYLSEINPQDYKPFSNEPDVMKVPHVARLLGVSPQTIRREISANRLKCLHVGASVRISKSQLLEYVKNQGGI